MITPYLEEISFFYFDVNLFPSHQLTKMLFRPIKPQTNKLTPSDLKQILVPNGLSGQLTQYVKANKFNRKKPPKIFDNHLSDPRPKLNPRSPYLATTKFPATALANESK